MESNFEGHATRIWGNARMHAMERKTGDAMQSTSNISRIAAELAAASKAEAALLLERLALSERDNLVLRLQKLKEKVHELESQIGKLKEQKGSVYK